MINRSIFCCYYNPIIRIRNFYIFKFFPCIKSKDFVSSYIFFRKFFESHCNFIILRITNLYKIRSTETTASNFCTSRSKDIITINIFLNHVIKEFFIENFSFFFIFREITCYYRETIRHSFRKNITFIEEFYENLL